MRNICEQRYAEMRDKMPLMKKGALTVDSPWKKIVKGQQITEKFSYVT